MAPLVGWRGLRWLFVALAPAMLCCSNGVSARAGRSSPLPTSSEASSSAEGKEPAAITALASTSAPPGRSAPSRGDPAVARSRRGAVVAATRPPRTSGRELAMSDVFDDKGGAAVVPPVQAGVAAGFFALAPR